MKVADGTWAGRRTGKRQSGEGINKPGDIVIYEHRDAEGNLQTPKEAWRQLNYRFHGIQPGKKAMEKRMKFKETNLRMSNTSGVVDTPLGTLGALQQRLKSSKQPFMKWDQ